MYDTLKLLHVLAATIWVGGAALLVFRGFRLSMNRDAGTQERLVFARDSLASGTVFAITGILTLVFGMWMVVDADGAIGWGDTWITFGFTGVALGAVLGQVFYGPQGRKLVAALESGDPAADAISRRLGMVSMLEILVLFVVIWAMVFKPGA